MTAIAVVEGVALLLLAILVVGLLRSHAEILRRLHALDDGGDTDSGRQLVQITSRGGSVTGEVAPTLAGVSLTDESVEIGLVGTGYDTVLAFLSSTCYTCEPFWASLAGGAEAPDGARVVIVVQAGDSLDRLRKLAGERLVVIRSDAAWAEYDVPGSPHFVYVDSTTGRVSGEGTASTWAQICDLLGQARQRSPGTDATPYPDPDGRDNATRIDAELLAAGIGPGHSSLYPDAQSGPDEPAAAG